MKIDSALKEFAERYDSEAMKSIEELGNEFGLKVNRVKFKAFNLKEAFGYFNDFLMGSTNYKIDCRNDPNAMTNEAVFGHAKEYINSKLFKECEILYSELPAFVESYITGVKTILETIDKSKTKLVEAGIDNESIGIINEYVDVFTNKLNETFQPVMEKILWASGYKTRKNLLDPKATIQKKPVFL
jgi:hypothetical protein